MRVNIAIWLTIAALFCAPLRLAGQEARGTILGRVSDSTNAVIVSAKVEATNAETEVHYASVTNGTGDYIMPFLTPGSYSISVEHPGFKTSTRSGIAVRERAHRDRHDHASRGSFAEGGRDRRNAPGGHLDGFHRAGV